MEYKRGKGAHKSPADYRNLKAKWYTGATPATNTPFTFYNNDFSNIPVHDQLQLGICTADAICGIIEKLYGDNVRLSRRFQYNVQKYDIDGNTDEGSALISALKSAQTYGVASEAMVPTDCTLLYNDFISLNPITFTPEIWADALKHKIGAYYENGTDIPSIKTGLMKFGHLYARVEAGSQWWTNPQGVNSWDPNQIFPIQPPTPTTDSGGHAIALKGYDFGVLGNEISFRNSWGNTWGLNGDGSFVYEQYMPNLTECWGITLGSVMPSNLPPANTFKYNFKNILAFGNTSIDVQNLQIALKILGYFDYPTTTGNYQVLTKEGVFQFQKDNISGLTSDDLSLQGTRVGPKTLAALNAIFNK